MKIAVIDIGTNSTLLLIAKVEKDKKPQILEDLIQVTRLGEGLSENKSLKKLAIERTSQAIGTYLEIAKDHSVDITKLIGTAALRVSKNSSEFIDLIKERFGMDIEVLSEEDEATLTFDASVRDFGEKIAVIDIGGGSTEIAISNQKPISLPLGCVKLTEECLLSDPVTTSEVTKAREAISKELPDITTDYPLIANAGTATTLGSIKLGLIEYDREKIHKMKVTSKEIKDIVDKLTSLSIRERKSIKGLMPERADVILAGLLILEGIMKRMKKSEVTISDLGVRWGIFYRTAN
ncbi:MAG: Ppx/GppA phosphatase family protein [Pseudomonadota bacterium]